MPQTGKLEIPFVPEAELFHDPLGSPVDRQCPGCNLRDAELLEANPQTGFGHFRGEALPPTVGQQSATADEMAATAGSPVQAFQCDPIGETRLLPSRRCQHLLGYPSWNGLSLGVR